MRYVSLGLAIGAMISGLVAAWYWYRGSIVKVTPKTDGRFGGGIASSGGPWTAGIFDAIADAGRLNKIAARWTALSVALSGLASVAGQC
jgi:hypothetical protein